MYESDPDAGEKMEDESKKSSSDNKDEWADYRMDDEEEAKKPQLGQPIETNEIAVTKDKEQSYDSEGLFGIDSNEDVDEDDDAESEQPEDTHSLG